jgi:hypothetical protein
MTRPHGEEREEERRRKRKKREEEQEGQDLPVWQGWGRATSRLGPVIRSGLNCIT